MFWPFVLAVILVLGLEFVVVAVLVRKKNLDRWLPSYFFGMNLCPWLNQPQSFPAPGQSEQVAESVDAGCMSGTAPGNQTVSRLTQVTGHRTPLKRFQHDEHLHVFIAVCDHYEPDNARPARHVADARIQRWCRQYPELFHSFEDNRGRPPQHSFFYPQDEYFVPAYLDQLQELCAAGFGDVEIHLHHDNDSEEGLQEKLESFRDTLHNRHGLLRRDPRTGRLTYGFIHGNWALCNSRADGRWCGVNDELTILRKTGCFADFTMPAAPEATQTRIVNSLYYAASDARSPGSHNRGTWAALGFRPPPKHLLMVQGPLMLDWQDRTRVVMPRIENADLLHHRPPGWHRFQHWLRCGIHVAGRPDWCFVKLHTHGCKDGNIDMLLGEQMQHFHHELANRAAARNNFHYYYVTAWEMAQLVHQAEAGFVKPVFGNTMIDTEPAGKVS